MCPKQWYGCQCLRFLLLILMWIEILLLYYLRMQLHRVCKQHKCTNCTGCANATSVPQQVSKTKILCTPQAGQENISCCTRKSYLRQQHAKPDSETLCQLSRILSWKSLRCKAKYSLSKAQVKHMIEHDHQMDWGPLLFARLCTSPEICSESNSLQTLQKSFGWDYKPRSPMCIIHMHAKRSHTHDNDPVVHVRVWWIMETPV